MNNLPDLPALVAKWRAASTRATDSANASRVPHVASVLDGAADTLRVCANELEAALSALNQAPGERLTECELQAVRAAMANADHDAGDYDDEDEDAQHARHLHGGLRKLLSASPTLTPDASGAVAWIGPGNLAALQKMSKDPPDWAELVSQQFVPVFPQPYGARVPLFTHPAPAAPAGFVMVPREPTRKMAEAGQTEASRWPAVGGGGISALGAIACWNAMLAASPTVEPAAMEDAAVAYKRAWDAGYEAAKVEPAESAGGDVTTYVDMARIIGVLTEEEIDSLHSVNDGGYIHEGTTRDALDKLVAALGRGSGGGSDG